MKRILFIIFLSFPLLGLGLLSCSKDNVGNGNGENGTSTGSITVYNKLTSSTPHLNNITRIEIFNDDFHTIDVTRIDKGKSNTISDIPEGTYSVKARITRSTVDAYETKTGVKVRKGQNTRVTFQ